MGYPIFVGFINEVSQDGLQLVILCRSAVLRLAEFQDGFHVFSDVDRRV